MPEFPSLDLRCSNCARAVSLEYSPGPAPVPSVFYCPYCHKPTRLEVPGQIRGLKKAENEGWIRPGPK